MTSRKMLATLVAAGALLALPTASQAGGLGLDRMHKCMFGWMAHFHHGAAVKGKVYKKKAVKKVRAAKAMPKK
jgi:hypothetical protein